MTTMNISLPEEMKAFVDAEAKARGFMTTSEYIRDLIRQQKEMADFRAKIIKGLESEVPDTSDEEFFASLRDKIASSK